MKNTVCIVLIFLVAFLSTGPVFASAKSLENDLSRAETLLAGFSSYKKITRIVAGILGLTTGAGLGLLLLNPTVAEAVDEVCHSPIIFFLFPLVLMYYLGVIAAPILLLSGLVALVIPSRAERDYKVIKKIEDPVVREEKSLGCLVSQASRAKTMRYIRAILSAVGAVVLVIAGISLEEGSFLLGTALGLGIEALAAYFIKSKEEILLDTYYSEQSGQDMMEVSELKPRLDVTDSGQELALLGYSF